jgi:hypothetical protein
MAERVGEFSIRFHSKVVLTIALDTIHWMCGSSIDSGVVILSTKDSGSTWSVFRSYPNGFAPKKLESRVQRQSSSFVWLVPDLIQNHKVLPFSVLSSIDYGATWKVEDTLLANRFWKFSSPGDGSLWFTTVSTGERFPREIDINTLWISSNHGKNLEVDSISFDGANLRDIATKDPRHAWVVADSAYDPLNPFSAHKSFVYMLDQSKGVNAEPAKEVASFRVYPMPAHESFRIEGLTSQQQHFSVYDCLGRSYLVPSNVKSGVVELDIRNLPAGAYFVLVQDVSRKVSRAAMVKY